MGQQARVHYRVAKPEIVRTSPHLVVVRSEPGDVEPPGQAPETPNVMEQTVPIPNLVPMQPTGVWRHGLRIGDGNVPRGDGPEAQGGYQISVSAYWLMHVPLRRDGKQQKDDEFLCITAVEQDGATLLYKQPRQPDPVFGYSRSQMWRFYVKNEFPQVCKVLNVETGQCMVVPYGISQDDIQLETYDMPTWPGLATWYFLPADFDAENWLAAAFVCSSVSNRHVTVSVNDPNQTRIVQYGPLTDGSIWKLVPVKESDVKTPA